MFLEPPARGGMYVFCTCCCSEVSLVLLDVSVVSPLGRSVNLQVRCRGGHFLLVSEQALQVGGAAECTQCFLIHKNLLQT